MFILNALADLFILSSPFLMKSVCKYLSPSTPLNRYQGLLYWSWNIMNETKSKNVTQFQNPIEKS